MSSFNVTSPNMKHCRDVLNARHFRFCHIKLYLELEKLCCKGIFVKIVERLGTHHSACLVCSNLASLDKATSFCWHCLVYLAPRFGQVTMGRLPSSQMLLEHDSCSQQQVSFQLNPSEPQQFFGCLLLKYFFGHPGHWSRGILKLVW